jgi:membrane protease YdiL (CAAX protease family)
MVETRTICSKAETLNALKDVLDRHPVLAFFVLAYGISWALWLPAVLARFQRGMRLEDGTLYLLLGNFGPFLAALVLTTASDGVSGVKALLKRLVHWRVGFLWYVIALYGFLVLGLLVILLFGVADLQDVLSEVPLAVIAVPANALTSFLVLGPLGEELGWRGYALPRLQAGYSGLTASVLLGILWAFWHSPLMLFPEWRNDVSIGFFLILYPLYIIPLAIIFTWVYNHVSGSVLVTMVLHSAFNYTVYFLDNTFEFSRYHPLAVQGVVSGLSWLVAVVLIGTFGPDLGLRRSVL